MTELDDLLMVSALQEEQPEIWQAIVDASMYVVNEQGPDDDVLVEIEIKRHKEGAQLILTYVPVCIGSDHSP